jgi:hypothetical protein
MYNLILFPFELEIIFLGFANLTHIRFPIMNFIVIIKNKIYII